MDLLAECDLKIVHHYRANNIAADYLSSIEIQANQPFALCFGEVPGSIQLDSLEGLEPRLKETIRYVTGEGLKEINSDERRKIRRGAKSYICWDETLFTRVKGSF